MSRAKEFLQSFRHPSKSQNPQYSEQGIPMPDETRKPGHLPSRADAQKYSAEATHAAVQSDPIAKEILQMLTGPQSVLLDRVSIYAVPVRGGDDGEDELGTPRPLELFIGKKPHYPALENDLDQHIVSTLYGLRSIMFAKEVVHIHNLPDASSRDIYPDESHEVLTRYHTILSDEELLALSDDKPSKLEIVEDTDPSAHISSSLTMSFRGSIVRVHIAKNGYLGDILPEERVKIV